jgi:hypothetical protein
MPSNHPDLETQETPSSAGQDGAASASLQPTWDPKGEGIRA